eukprot:12331-Heterococcus_DN1.PRE.4
MLLLYNITPHHVSCDGSSDGFHYVAAAARDGHRQRASSSTSANPFACVEYIASVKVHRKSPCATHQFQIVPAHTLKCSHHYADRCAQRCGLLVEQHTQHSTVPALSSSATGRAWFAATTA